MLGEHIRGFWKRLLGKPDETLAHHLATLSKKVLAAYEPMRRAVEKQGLDGPDLNADAGITMMPYVYLRRVMKLGADPDFTKVPRFYPEGAELPEPFKSLGPTGAKLDTDGVRALLDRTLGPAPALVPTLFCGFTGLHLVAECDRAEAVDVLVRERGVDPCAQSLRGDTALHFACLHGAWASARALLAHDRDGRATRTRNVSGYTPLGVCAVMNRPGGIDVLYAEGVRVSEPELDEVVLAARWGCRAAFERFRDLSGIPTERVGELEAILGDAERRQSQ
jgi:Ankyrin repeats (3 copies)